jgi:hypothetical protein
MIADSNELSVNNEKWKYCQSILFLKPIISSTAATAWSNSNTFKKLHNTKATENQIDYNKPYGSYTSNSTAENKNGFKIIQIPVAETLLKTRTNFLIFKMVVQIFFVYFFIVILYYYCGAYFFLKMTIKNKIKNIKIGCHYWS